MIRGLQGGDGAQWSSLFRDYRSGARLPHQPDVVSRVWSWLVDPDHPSQALVAEIDGRLVGFAHYRRFPRPILGDTGLDLDDLYTDPATRGRGVARALVDGLAELAGVEGLVVVRWSTRTDNAAARRLYDRLATAADTVTYNLTP